MIIVAVGIGVFTFLLGQLGYRELVINAAKHTGCKTIAIILQKSYSEKGRVAVISQIFLTSRRLFLIVTPEIAREDLIAGCKATKNLSI